MTGRFGLSIASRRAVGIEMVERLWPTLALGGLSTVIAVVLTVPLALLSAVRRGGWADQAIKLVFIAAMSMPAFWLGLLLVLLLSIALPIFPVSGYGEGFFEAPGSVHRVSDHASGDVPASLLAIFVADDGAQLTRGAPK